ncbi:MAG: Na+/H+ antiporter NhaA [Solirubrobacteraceae bacterium]
MEAAAPPSAGRTAWARNLGAPVRDFLRTESGGALMIVAAALVALLWANSPWPGSYESVWSTKLAVTLGDHALAADLRQWVNEGLMTLFFLVVGLEAKRELDLGEMRERARIAIPVIAALGGMAAAVGIYAAVNAGGPGAHGWGAAMSTDTALALGVLALVAPTGATRLRVFLLTLVVIDDLAALLVIAVAYTGHVSLVALGVAVALFAVLFSVRFIPGRSRSAAAIIVGTGIWVAMFESGVDPVIVGLAIGLVTSAYPPGRDDLERATREAREFREQPTPELAASAQRSLAAAISPNERLQYRLHPWTSFLVVPLFALANAGIHLDGALLDAAVGSPVTIGLFLAYVVGKPLGIVGASWLATRRTLGGRRLAVTWPGLLGTGAAAGMGFTVSLLIAGLAFGGAGGGGGRGAGGLLVEAKLGVLAAAVVSPLLAWTVFQVIARMPEAVRARQLGRTAEQLIDLSDDVDPERDHVRGRDDAPVTLLEYANFECPYCGRAEPVIRELLAEYGDDLRYVFRHLPLADVHPHAQMAAEATEAAGAQGAFWEMHDQLFAHQGELTPKDVRGYAAELGLDIERFTDELRRRRYAPRVHADIASADASGVSGTPSFFINGRRHHGVYDTAALTAAVRAARALAPPRVTTPA